MKNLSDLSSKISDEANIVGPETDALLFIYIFHVYLYYIFIHILILFILVVNEKFE
jgi:hypothetical protein